MLFKLLFVLRWRSTRPRRRPSLERSPWKAISRSRKSTNCCCCFGVRLSSDRKKTPIQSPSLCIRCYQRYFHQVRESATGWPLFTPATATAVAAAAAVTHRRSVNAATQEALFGCTTLHAAHVQPRVTDNAEAVACTSTAVSYLIKCLQQKYKLQMQINIVKRSEETEASITAIRISSKKYIRN